MYSALARILREMTPLRYSVREMPHLVLEPTFECNMRCRACYNRVRDVRKDFSQIVQEIELGRRKRNLDTISILGGEPTLYPDLPRIVRYIKSRGLHCQLLTNGLRFADPDGEAYLDELLRSGLDRIVVHRDEGQGTTTNDTADFHRTVFPLLESHWVYFGLALTLYPDNRDRLSDKIRDMARYRFFDGMLVTLLREALDIARRKAPPPALTLEKVHQHLAYELQLVPSTYLPTSLSANHPSWLIYFYYLDTATYATFCLSNRLTTLFRRAYRLISGHHLFGMTLDPRWFKLMFYLTLLAEVLLNPARLDEARRFLRRVESVESLRFHYLVLQRGPEYHRGRDTVEICYHCPDATIRNGKLTPVCLADWINPLPGKPADEVAYWMSRPVFEHLEEEL